MSGSGRKGKEEDKKNQEDALISKTEAVALDNVLPLELWLHILSFLTPHQLAVFCGVSTGANSLVKVASLWRPYGAKSMKEYLIKNPPFTFDFTKTITVSVYATADSLGKMDSNKKSFLEKLTNAPTGAFFVSGVETKDNDNHQWLFTDTPASDRFSFAAPQYFAKADLIVCFPKNTGEVTKMLELLKTVNFTDPKTKGLLTKGLLLVLPFDLDAEKVAKKLSSLPAELKGKLHCKIILNADLSYMNRGEILKFISDSFNSHKLICAPPKAQTNTYDF